MTISAKQAEVFSVGGPVLESPRPSVVPILGANLFRGVYVIYINGAVICKSTLRALAPERGYQFKFAFPVARFLMDRIAVVVPVGFLTMRSTKTRFCFLSAPFALPCVRPSMGQVAGLAAKLSGSIFESVSVHLRRLLTVLACDLNALGSHCLSLSELASRKYFDIACQRIEQAQKQVRMFE
jgi:hypothetical protein